MVKLIEVCVNDDNYKNWKFIQNEYMVTLLIQNFIFKKVYMKRLILILIVLPLLTNCTQYSAMMNPSITLATGGTIS